MQSRKRTVKSPKARNQRNNKSTKSPKKAVPNSEPVTLTFKRRFDLTTGVSGVSWANFVETNNVLQLDPHDSTTTPGFSAESIKFAEYEPLWYKGFVEFAPVHDATTAATLLDATCHVVHALTNHSISAGGSAADLTAAASLGRGNSSKLLASVGSGKVKHSFRRTFKSLVGNTTNTDAFRSASNTAPANLTYLLFGFTSAGSGTNVLTCTAFVSLTIAVRFFTYVDTLTSKDGVPSLVNVKCAACFFQSGKPFTPCCSACRACPVCGWTAPCTKENPLRFCKSLRPILKMLPPMQRQLSSGDLVSTIDKFTQT